ncbi:MAG: peptidoglycan-binding protein [Cyanobacteria bacterium J06621_11]
MCITYLLSTAVLTIGAKGSTVRALQRQLNMRIEALGLMSSMSVAVDGVFGRKTLTAVKYLQCVGGFPVNGQVDESTMLFITQGAAGLPKLSSGDARTRMLRTCVAAVQRTMWVTGVSVVVDGCFGPQTTAALEVYQQQMGLPVSGVVDGATWEMIVRSRLTTLPCAALLPNPSRR